jgi:hypothetical protein
LDSMRLRGPVAPRMRHGHLLAAILQNRSTKPLANGAFHM